MAYYQHNMLSIKSRTLLANIIAEVVLLSESVQSYREALANIQFFDCIALFRFLDREEKGYLREKDFERAIGTSHRKLLTYAFGWFDNMKVGEVSRLEFAVFLLPKDNLQLRQLVAERVQNPQISYSQHETILEQFQIFRRLLLEMMRRQMKIIELRRQLIRSDDYSSKGLLVVIDSNDHRWVCAEDLFKFLKNYGFDVNLRQVEKLVEVINSSLDGRISEQQLSWTVEGFETKNKSYLNKIKASNKKQERTPQKTARQQPKSIPEQKMQLPSTLSEEFSHLMEKMKLAELEEQQVDEELVKYDIESIQENKKLCQIKLEQISQQKLSVLKQWSEMEKQRLLEQQYRRSEVQARLIREAEVLRQTERLNRLENKLLHYADYEPPAEPAYNNKRLYSFTEESPSPYKAKPFEIIDAHIPISRKDYKNLTNLNSLSIVESHRKASGRSDAPHNRLSQSTDYFNTASQMKQKIKRQLQIQKSIQERFSRGEYNTSRFNSRVIEQRQDTSHSKGQKVVPSELHVLPEDQAFASPERTANFMKSGANKFTVSTGNKFTTGNKFSSEV